MTPTVNTAEPQKSPDTTNKLKNAQDSPTSLRRRGWVGPQCRCQLAVLAAEPRERERVFPPLEACHCSRRYPPADLANVSFVPTRSDSLSHHNNHASIVVFHAINTSVYLCCCSLESITLVAHQCCSTLAGVLRVLSKLFVNCRMASAYGHNQRRKGGETSKCFINERG